jgi:hypothetical protein
MSDRTTRKDIDRAARALVRAGTLRNDRQVVSLIAAFTPEPYDPEDRP